MEDDPYEIWREAMKEISAQQELANHEFELEMQARLEGEKMDEEKKEQDRFTRALAMVRGFTFLILVSVIGLLTIALVADWLNGTEFIAASIVWFGMGVLFLWGTEFVKKEKEDE